jgi:hypothetical protein
LTGICSGISGNLNDIPMDEREGHLDINDWVK